MLLKSTSKRYQHVSKKHRKSIPKRPQNPSQNPLKMVLDGIYVEFPFMSRILRLRVPTWLQLGSQLGLQNFKDPSQDGQKRARGAFLKGTEKGLQHRRLLRSIFHGFWVHFGGHVGLAEDNKTLACVCPKTLWAICAEGKFQEPLGNPKRLILGGFRVPNWGPKTYKLLARGFLGRTTKFLGPPERSEKRVANDIEKWIEVCGMGAVPT